MYFYMGYFLPVSLHPITLLLAALLLTIPTSRGNLTFVQAQMDSKTERNKLVGKGTQYESKTLQHN